MAKRRKDADMRTEQIQAELLFKHFDRISILITDAEHPLRPLDTAAAFAEIIVSSQLDQDTEYLRDVEAIAEHFSDSGNRPKGMDPAQWRMQRRLRELRAIWKSSVENGVLAKKSAPLVDDLL